MTIRCDLAIVGAGMGGALLAMVARRLGRRVLLLERGRHPRFAIGESSSPLAGILLEQLAERYDLPRLRPLAAYGAWRRSHPALRRGLKRGFTFYRHEAGRPFTPRADRANELLVAASPNDDVADTHWLRADVDAWLVDEAVALGATYLDECRVERVVPGEDGVRLEAVRAGHAVLVEAAGLVDATGPRGCLHRLLALEDRGFSGFPATQALYTHFDGVRELAALDGFGRRTDSAEAPYPIDAAAVHHVLDGGWVWVLRFDHGVTSAGVAAVDAVADDLRFAEGGPAWQRLLARYPSLATQFDRARPIRPFDWMPRVSYRASRAAGPRWALLPSAAAFVDPLFSTGFPLTLLGVERLGALLGQGLFGPAHDAGHAARLDAYGAQTLRDADHTARFIAGCYAAFGRFDVFATYALFYFAAASYAESLRRLHGGDRGFGFLGVDTPAFAASLTALSPATSVPSDGAVFARLVRAAIAPYDVAGLSDPTKRHWFGVDVNDLRAGASKLGATSRQVEALLEAMGVS